MTILYVGNRQDITCESSWDEILDLQEDLITEWRQLSFKPTKKLFLNLPKEPPKGLSPKGEYDLGLEQEAISEPWRRWTKQRGVKVHVIKPLTQKQVEEFLAKGIRGLTFTEAAVSQFLTLMPVINKKRFMDLFNLLVLNYPNPKELTPRDVAEVLGGETVVLAAQFVEALGTSRAITIARRAASSGSSGAASLLNYTFRVLDKDPRVFMLHLCWKGMIDQRWSPKSALEMFAFCCLNTSYAKDMNSVLPRITERTLDLFQLLGIPSQIGGSIREKS